ncbi:SigE family RNA polymerase sigma factor [Streptacidiphilus melanogenes]|uniref:SigE family RNA polymerase sigma factor n=1 Tax=Streptacidiphilus melanogenes TaxID=411235 RepID=UPI000A863661|nr:SigE family RNA polymerase sigma factor [Streptacidiphilus melanogenes]
MQNGTAAAIGGRRGGDEGWGDFSSFVAARWTALVRTAYLLTGDFHEAEDLVQVTLAKVYPHWRGLRAETTDAYVRRALVNNNRSRHRRRRVAHLLMPFVPDRPAAADAGQGDVAERDLLVSLLATLPERQRTVVVLRYWEDLSAEEVAELLGCSVGTVKSQASRALAKLRDLPELEEFALTGLGAER